MKTLLALRCDAPAARVLLRAAGGVPVGEEIFLFPDPGRALRAAEGILEDGLPASIGLAGLEEGEAAARAAADAGVPVGITATSDFSDSFRAARGTWLDLGPVLPGARGARRFLRNPVAMTKSARAAEEFTPSSSSHAAPRGDPASASNALWAVFWILLVLLSWALSRGRAPVEFEILPSEEATSPR